MLSTEFAFLLKASYAFSICTRVFWNQQKYTLLIKTVRSYYTPLRIAKIQNTGNTKCGQECGSTETRSLLIGMQNSMATLEDSLEVSLKQETYSLHSQ